jgi:hypothetical protein
VSDRALKTLSINKVKSALLCSGSRCSEAVINAPRAFPSEAMFDPEPCNVLLITVVPPAE